MTAHHELEGRYRRLMTAYPWRHRREYEEEMVGVLMAAAKPGQRRPSVRDRADLLGNALAVHFRGWVGDLGDDAWRRAAYAVQLAGALLLLVVGLRRLALPGLSFRFGVDEMDVARPAVWAVVLVLALAGLRRVATGFALTGAAVEIVHVAQWYAYSPSQVLRSSWLVTVALLVAVTSAWLAGGERVAVPRGLWRLCLALSVAAAGSIADHFQIYFSGFEYAMTMNDKFLFRYAAPLYLIAVALAGWAWWRQGSLVRRRILALAAPVAGIAAMVAYGFAGFMYSSQQFPSPILLRPVQWAVLVATPVVAFVLAAVLVNRWERVRALVELGRRSERV